MELNYIVFAIPVFLALIILEVILDKARKKKTYRLNDAISNLTIGIGEQTISVFGKILQVLLFSYIYDNFRFFTLPINIWTGIILFLIFDFIFYWAHRLGHESNLFWAGHIVHHSSEDYNLTVALRQPWFYSYMSFFLFLPIALLGFSPFLLVIVASLDTVYQFWIHTQHIGKLGWFEYIFNTPSHHRVHHGQNTKYLDKNYGGVLIIWDRIFGTFQVEEEKVIYGITSPLKSWNPAWANVHYYFDLYHVTKQIKGFKNKIKFIFAPPGWMPKENGGFKKPSDERLSDFKKFDIEIPSTINYYALVNFTVLITFFSFYLYFEPQLLRWQSALIGGYILIYLSLMGLIFEKKKYAYQLEFVRSFILGLVFYFCFLPISQIAAIVLLIAGSLIGIVSIVWLIKIIKYDLRFV
jgi:alkylglycerol monooxygenase